MIYYNVCIILYYNMLSNMIKWLKILSSFRETRTTSGITKARSVRSSRRRMRGRLMWKDAWHCSPLQNFLWPYSIYIYIYYRYLCTDIYRMTQHHQISANITSILGKSKQHLWGHPNEAGKPLPWWLLPTLARSVMDSTSKNSQD